MNRIKQLLNSKYAYIFYGGALASVCGGIYWLVSSRRSLQRRQQLSRETVIKVLRKFERDYYPIYKSLMASYSKAVAGIQAKYGFVPAHLKAKMYQVLVQTNVEFRNLVEELETRVYSHFEITDRRAFEVAADRLRRTDAEAISITRRIQSNLVRICRGQPLDLSFPIAQHITAEVTFRVFREISYTILMKLNQFLSDRAARRRPANVNSPKFVRKLTKAIRVEDLTRDLLKQNGFNYSDRYHEQMVYDAAVAKFLRTDPKYYDPVSRVIRTEKTLLDVHLGADPNLEELRQRIQQIKFIQLKTEDSMANVAYSMRDITFEGRVPRGPSDPAGLVESTKNATHVKQAIFELPEDKSSLVKSPCSTRLDFDNETKFGNSDSSDDQSGDKAEEKSPVQMGSLLYDSNVHSRSRAQTLKNRENKLVDLDDFKEISKELV